MGNTIKNFKETCLRIAARQSRSEVMGRFKKPEEWWWMQDRATPHTANATQTFLREAAPEFITKDKWPSKSPDLNPCDY